jgi:MoaA/NifB/PqqE/SkfB family radical SAM enzyme
MLHPDIWLIIKEISRLGMHSNIITNGTLPIEQYESVFLAGLNHLQISVHNLGLGLDLVTGVPDSGTRQARLLEWLHTTRRPFRTNTTMQKLNYKRLPQIAEYLCVMKAFHVALLGFLPHYEWKEYLDEVAVHPALLRPYIEQAAAIMEEQGMLFTIRYHPLCHLSPKYWKYVVNARYVLFDPWEWDYGWFHLDLAVVREHAMQLGESVAIQGVPCSQCKMRLHCGGWNRHYAVAFDGADLVPITKVPYEYDHVFRREGGLHDMNPANGLKGFCKEGITC